MDSRRIVFRETAIIAVGEAICCGIMVGVFALLNSFSMNVLWGAADRAEQGNVEQGKKMIRLSSTVRLVVMLVIMLIAIKLGANVIALALPLLFARPVLMLAEFFRKKGD